MAVQSFQLIMRSGPTPGKELDLQQAELTLGRDVTNDIVVNDPEVSRKHARLTASVGGYVIEDLGSTNGTFINGQRLLGPHLLNPGELIMIGENVSLKYEATSYDPDATIVSGAAALPPAPSAAPQFQTPARQTAPLSPKAAPEPGPTALKPPPGPPPQSQSAPPVYPGYAQPAPQPAQPAYNAPLPAQPVYEPAGEAYEPSGGQGKIPRTWIYAGVGCLVVMCCVLVIAAFAFDSLNMYCSPPFNMIFSPCP